MQSINVFAELNIKHGFKNFPQKKLEQENIESN
jgi:hypothetical protein